MAYAMLGLMIVGAIVAFVGGIMFLVKAFQTSTAWGIGCLLLSFPVSLIFLVKYWQESRKSFLIQVVGMALVIVAVLLGGTVDTAQALPR